jgi:ribosome maturation factor RimP
LLSNEKIEELLNPYLNDNDLSLYSIEWVKEFGSKILRVCIDKKGGINSDDLALVNNYLSEKLDSYEKEMPDDYMLEVSSPGAEKELRNEEEVLESVGMKVNVKTLTDEYEGKLLSFENGILVVSINLKGRIKKIEIEYNTIKKIRLAV